MRNSVKVVIDAFDGTVTAYVADPRDPLVLTLAKVFPGIFQPLDAMSRDLRAHLRYPEDLFRVQTDLYATYHMAEPDVFYHREYQWQKPVLWQRAVVAHENRAVREEALEAGLTRWFGGGGAVETAAAAVAPSGAAGPSNRAAADLARRAADLYQRAVAAQRSGDWARYGEALSQ